MRSHDHARSSITDPSPAVSRIRRRSYGAVWRTPPNALKQASSDTLGPTPPEANKPSKSHERTPSGGHLSHTRPSKSPHFRLSADELGPDFELPPAMTSVESLGDGTICSHTSAPIVEPPRAIPSRVFNGTVSKNSGSFALFIYSCPRSSQSFQAVMRPHENLSRKPLAPSHPPPLFLRFLRYHLPTNPERHGTHSAG